MITTVTLNTAVDKLYFVEKVEYGAVMRVNEVCNTAGGKGLNVSKVAALAGEQVTATGFLGGFNGRYVASLLESAGIAARFAEIAAETRSCINIRDLATGKHTEYLEPGAEIAPQNLEEFLRIFREVLPGSAVVTISGSAPRGTPAGFYGKIIRLCKDAAKPVIVDTSGELLREAVRTKPFMIKPNTDEIGQLLGETPRSTAEILAAAKRLHESGIAYVAVSLGKAGAILVCDEGAFSAEPPDVPVVNTVGCGDSMVAGFAVGLSRGYPTEETLAFANAISTSNAQSVQTGHITAPDIPALQKQVKILKLQ